MRHKVLYLPTSYQVVLRLGSGRRCIELTSPDCQAASGVVCVDTTYLHGTDSPSAPKPLKEPAVRWCGEVCPVNKECSQLDESAERPKPNVQSQKSLLLNHASSSVGIWPSCTIHHPRTPPSIASSSTAPSPDLILIDANTCTCDAGAAMRATTSTSYCFATPSS